MSARAERAFLPALREVERGLKAPLPDRIQILRELESDLEELWGRLVADGLPEEEAHRRAMDALVPDAGTLGELDRLHTPMYRQLTRHLSSGILRLAERSALALATTSVLLVQTATLVRADLLKDPSPFLWPVLAAGGLLFALVVGKSFQLWIKRDHSDPGRGLSNILVVSGGIFALGMAGMIFDFYRLASTLEKAPELAAGLAAGWLVRDSALLSVAVILALAGGLAWFILSQWLALVSGAHRDLLGLDYSVQTEGD